ncbi:MAG: hypothetical protein IKX14_04465, partial [Neisseriaceae bacterium]|nr:hypothetical protein [Neisseriaceae bacterium]
VAYHKQTIDSINRGISNIETEQNKLKLEAQDGFNQTPESQVLFNQLKEKFPRLWQSEKQEQGVSASEKTTERLPENTVQGTGTPEISETAAVQYAQSFVGKKWNSQNIQDAVILPDGKIQLQIGGEWYHENALSYSNFEQINKIALQAEHSNLDILKLKAFRRTYQQNIGNHKSEISENARKYNDDHSRKGAMRNQGALENAMQVIHRVDTALEEIAKANSGSPEIEKQGTTTPENSVESQNLSQTKIQSLLNRHNELIAAIQPFVEQVDYGDEFQKLANENHNVIQAVMKLAVGETYGKGNVEYSSDNSKMYVEFIYNDDPLGGKSVPDNHRRMAIRHFLQNIYEPNIHKTPNPKLIENEFNMDKLTTHILDLWKQGKFQIHDDGKSVTKYFEEQIRNNSEFKQQGTTTPEISETAAVSHDLAGQPETSQPVVLTKEQKAELKAAKTALDTAKKELKGLRDELKNTRPHQVSYYLQWKEEKRQAVSEKQASVRELSRQYDELNLELKTQTGEITDLEKEILTARLSGSLKERFDIAFRELKTQKEEIGVKYNELKARIDNKDFYEFEIQSVMQDAVAYYGGTRGVGVTLYHKGKPLPLTTDREKAIAYLLQVELPKQLYDEFGKPFNALARKISKLSSAKFSLEHTNIYDFTQDQINGWIDQLEDAENQLMKGSIEERAEINLTYDINTPDGEQKVRELFYNSKHDEAQAELFEKVFAMAQKLNVEVRHALRDETMIAKRDTKYIGGWYMLDKNSARVKHSGNIKVERKGEILLHELVHSVTSRAMFLKEQGQADLLNPAQVKAIEEIEKIYQKVCENAKALGFDKWIGAENNMGSGDYGLKNSHEFIAELANPVFREKLKQVVLFDDTVKAITEVATGVEKTETAYDRLTAALYQIMDNYEPDFGARFEQAKYGNIKMNDIFRQPEQQEQKMKTSRDILAEVMSKYETHIDSKTGGIMNRPVHWLSDEELEDRRTVLASRIDIAIQNSDKETEERLDIDYVKVENEKARRETLAANLKEVLNKQPETLSVRDLMILNDSKTDLYQQMQTNSGNFEFADKALQQLAAINAKIEA